MTHLPHLRGTSCNLSKFSHVAYRCHIVSSSRNAGRHRSVMGSCYIRERHMRQKLMFHSCHYVPPLSNAKCAFVIFHSRPASHRYSLIAYLSSESKHSAVLYSSVNKNEFHKYTKELEINKSKSHTTTTAKSKHDIIELTRKLLSKADQNPSVENFERTLQNARTNESLLNTLALSTSDVKSMFILPPDLLKDVNIAISHFSRNAKSNGIFLEEEMEMEVVKSLFATNQRVPAPMICLRLLELIGLPFYYMDFASLSSSQLIVHSSQIDDILNCCLKTNLALLKCCNVGKDSLIGYDFNFCIQPWCDNDISTGRKKTAAQLAEEIWRSVWNMYIKYTDNETISRMPPERPEIKGNFSNRDAVLIYLNKKPVEQTDESDVKIESEAIMWSKKDVRRYDQSVTLFNTVLAAYAKLSSSSTGGRLEMRRDMVQTAERLLLEVVGKHDNLFPSRSTILACVRPDIISYNTVIKAWAEWSPKQKQVDSSDRYSSSMATLVAERTQAILEMMQELWDEERSNRTTVDALKAAWEGNREGDLHSMQHIAPSTPSYNTVLNAWSRSSENDVYKAITLLRTMVKRHNVSCLSRDILMTENDNQQDVVRRMSYSSQITFPDSRTFVAMLDLCGKRVPSMDFRDAMRLVDYVFATIKQWNEQLRWSQKNKILSQGLEKNDCSNPIINKFTSNALIKTLMTLSKKTWEESYQCCLRIDEIISQESDIVNSSTVVSRGMALRSWTKCEEFAEMHVDRIQLCVEKVSAHIDCLLTAYIHSPGSLHIDSDNIRNTSGRVILHSVHDAIAFYGKAAMPVKANELFLRVKEFNISNIDTLILTVDALCKNSVQNVSHVISAQDYLFEFEQEMMVKSHSVVPDMKYTRIYNAIIAGFIQAEKQGVFCDTALNLLEHMIDSHAANTMHIARPNTTSFALVMNALAQLGLSSKVEELLFKMEALCERRKLKNASSSIEDQIANVVPNIVIYNIVMKSYACSKDSNALQSALKLLHRMESDSNIPSPDEVTHSLISTIQKRRDHYGTTIKTNGTTKEQMQRSLSGRIASSPQDDSLLSMDDSIEQSIRINQTPTKTLSSMIKMHATSGTVEGAEKAWAILMRLEEMYCAGDLFIKPDIHLYNIVLNSWKLCEQNSQNKNISPSEKAEEILDFICDRHDAGNKGISPNCNTFSTCIQAWCKSDQPGAADRAEQILRRKELFSKIDGSIVIKTNDYNAIMTKWREDPDKGPERASLLFEKIIQKSSGSESYQSPTAVTLNALLEVYAKSNLQDSAEQAEEYLKRMEKMYREGKSIIVPDVVSYRSCIDAWIRKKQRSSPQKVETLVNDMIQKFKAEGRKDLMPDSNCINLILKACQAAPNSWNNMESMARNDHPIAIANRAFSLLYRRNEFNAKCTHSTYAFMFCIYNRHMNFKDPRYSTLMRNLWLKCCQDGLVSEFSLESFRLSVTESEFYKAVGEHRGTTNGRSVSAKSLPWEWRKNVAPSQKPQS